MFNARALGQSAQAEQDTLILYSSQESVMSSHFKKMSTVRNLVHGVVLAAPACLLAKRWSHAEAKEEQRFKFRNSQVGRHA